LDFAGFGGIFARRLFAASAGGPRPADVFSRLARNCSMGWLIPFSVAA